MAKKIIVNPQITVNPSGAIPPDAKVPTRTLADMASSFVPPDAHPRPPADPAVEAAKHAPKGT